MRPKQSQLPVIRTLGRLRGAFWRRRVLHWLVRAAWLALLVPAAVMGGYLWFDWRVAWDIWVLFMLFVGLLALLWSSRPINLKKMTHRLDKLLGRQAQLVTAFEASYVTSQTANPVVEQLIRDTVNLTVTLRRQVPLFGRGFWLEVHALVAIIAILGAMLVFEALTTTIPNATPIELPSAGQEPPAEAVVPPVPDLQPQLNPEDGQTLSAAQLQAALEALADALRDQAVTRSIADEIDRGDVAGAASEVRRLVDRLDGLSEQTLGELGDNLQEAASNIGPEAPSLTDPLEGGSQALEAGDLAGTGQALEQLAEALDAISEAMPENPSSDGGDQTEESEAAEESGQEGEGPGAASGEGESSDQLLEEEEGRLPIDGQPLELESDSDVEERVLQPAELDVEAGDERTSDSPFARQALNSAGAELGPDPLAYPWEKRDIIRRYFTP